MPSLSDGINSIGTVNIGNFADVLTTGTITVTDAVVPALTGNGVTVSGAPTVGSYIGAASPGGLISWDILITGLTSGTLYFEISLDSTTGIDGNWINVNAQQTGITNTTLSYSTTVNGIFRSNLSGAKWVRVRSVGVLTGTPAIVFRQSFGIGAIFLNASIPTGSNVIGKFTSTNDATATLSVAGTALVVVKASAGRLVSVLVTAVGTANVPIYDNASAASGTIIGYVNFAQTYVGQTLVFASPAILGITVGGVVGGSTFTVNYV